ncbi:MAG TPA: hypothetical protein VE291_04925 [Terracidiphilus sp.]|nr:hypothetical protein [Terracidiphilus sp.]
MNLVPVMWMVWSALVVLTVALYIYRANLTKDEEDQIFLDDSFQSHRDSQAAIVAKVQKLQPLLRATLALTCVATLLVVGYYITDFMRQFQ